MLAKMLTWIAAMMMALQAVNAWTVSFQNEIAKLPGDARFVEVEVRRDGRAIRIHGVFFSQARCLLRVVDNPAPGVGNLASTMEAGGFIAGVNGGYFHPDFRPAGLAVAQGRTIHGFQKAKLLSGVLAITPRGPALLRSGEYKPAKTITDALQAGPFLVDGGEQVQGLNATKLARRTVVMTDGRGGWAILVFSYVSLSDAASILSSPGSFRGWTVKRALNLDGGSSTALWVATAPKPFYLPELSSVRNYLGVLPKGP